MNIPLNPIESHEIPIKKSRSPAILGYHLGTKTHQNTQEFIQVLEGAATAPKHLNILK